MESLTPIQQQEFNDLVERSLLAMKISEDSIETIVETFKEKYPELKYYLP